MNKKNNFIIKGLKKSLIASCQPIPKGPLDSSSFILASAKASIIGGAKALRIEGFKNLKVVKKNINLPVRVGFPGPASFKTLLNFGIMSGVGNSINFLKKNSSKTSRL